MTKVSKEEALAHPAVVKALADKDKEHAKVVAGHAKVVAAREKDVQAAAKNGEKMVAEERKRIVGAFKEHVIATTGDDVPKEHVKALKTFAKGFGEALKA